MLFNKKAKQLTLEEGLPTTHCKLGISCLERAEHTKYLVTIQSNLICDQHIKYKYLKPQKLLGGIKHLINVEYDALTEAKLLVYISHCSPILEYADVVLTLQLALRVMIQSWSKTVQYVYPEI